ncbi:hypothetical protein BJ912DRAFT_139979 [Pholiota molesta]|nr:hypothetical protein BJ912DRAFT_139979 [Pholiota molesta]
MSLQVSSCILPRIPWAAGRHFIHIALTFAFAVALCYLQRLPNALPTNGPRDLQIHVNVLPPDGTSRDPHSAYDASILPNRFCLLQKSSGVHKVAELIVYISRVCPGQPGSHRSACIHPHRPSSNSAPFSCAIICIS